jgi:hypothetical protein
MSINYHNVVGGGKIVIDRIKNSHEIMGCQNCRLLDIGLNYDQSVKPVHLHAIVRCFLRFCKLQKGNAVPIVRLLKSIDVSAPTFV